MRDADVVRLQRFSAVAYFREKAARSVNTGSYNIRIFKSSSARKWGDFQSALVCVKVCRSVRLRGGRSCADGARGTYPSGLPFSAAAGNGAAIFAAAPCPARQKHGGPGGWMRL